MKRLVIVAVLIVLRLSVNAESVPASPAASPEAVVKQMFSVSREADWPGYVKLMHPEALAEFKKMFREIVATEVGKELGTLFFDTKSADEYDAVESAVLFERFMKNLSVKVPQFGEALKTAEGSVVGSVPEGADLVHVVYRSSASAEGIAISRVNAVTLRKHQGEWRLLLTGNIEGIAARLGQLAE